MTGRRGGPRTFLVAAVQDMVERHARTRETWSQTAKAWAGPRVRNGLTGSEVLGLKCKTAYRNRDNDQVLRVLSTSHA